MRIEIDTFTLRLSDTHRTTNKSFEQIEITTNRKFHVLSFPFSLHSQATSIVEWIKNFVMTNKR